MVACPRTNVTNGAKTKHTMAELHRVFFPDILTYIININFGRVECHLISIILREIVVKMFKQVKQARDITLHTI